MVETVQIEDTERRPLRNITWVHVQRSSCSCIAFAHHRLGLLPPRHHCSPPPSPHHHRRRACHCRRSTRMENRKPELARHGRTTSAPPSRAISGVPQPRGIFGIETSSMPLLPCTSGSEQPPRPNPPLPAKTRRRPFVVSAPRLVEGTPIPGHDAPSPGEVLPRQLLAEVVDPSTMGLLCLISSRVYCVLKIMCTEHELIMYANMF
jgi:hypothetical protein